MEQILDETALIRLVEAYVRNSGEKESVVSRHIFNNTHSIDRIRNGSSLRVDTFNNAIAWLSDHWGDYPWVEGIPRPKPREIHTASLTHASNGVY